MKFERIEYEIAAEGVARITLNRPDKKNAQDSKMLYELDEAFTAAGLDDSVKVVILAAKGTDFSSGHDLSGDMSAGELRLPCAPVVHQVSPDGKPGAEGIYAYESDAYLGLCLRWRNFPKPTIAQVQGRAIGGGLMLIWPCDIIIAADDALFSDPVVALGLNGIEYMAHPWELGHRKAKEMLFTGAPVDAATAYRCGMVNHLAPAEDLSRVTLELAQRIASRPMFALTLAKRSVNAAQDSQGFREALNLAFMSHQLGHTDCLQRHGIVVDPDGPAIIRAEAKRTGPAAIGERR